MPLGSAARCASVYSRYCPGRYEKDFVGSNQKPRISGDSNSFLRKVNDCRKCGPIMRNSRFPKSRESSSDNGTDKNQYGMTAIVPTSAPKRILIVRVCGAVSGSTSITREKNRRGDEMKTVMLVE